MNTIVTAAEDIGRVGAERFVALGREALSRHGAFNVALSGGSTPRSLYEKLEPDSLPWERVDLFFGDERLVPGDHELSNYRMVGRALLERVPGARAHFLEDPDAYAELLRAKLGEAGRFDLLLLGMGEDGHTASLFPGSPALGEATRWVVAAQGAPPATERLTITPPLIRRALHVILLVAGAAKAKVLAGALEGPDGQYPIQVVRQCEGKVEWIVDRTAASLLRKDTTADRG